MIKIKHKIIATSVIGLISIFCKQTNIFFFGLFINFVKNKTQLSIFILLFITALIIEKRFKFFSLIYIYLLFKLKILTPSRATTYIQNLGPSYIKLAQILSQRPDILSETYANSFQKLLDNNNFDQQSYVKKMLSKSLITKDLLMNELKPLASGSIASVFKYQNNVIKILHKDVPKIIPRELAVIAFFRKVLLMIENKQNKKLIYMLDFTSLRNAFLEQSKLNSEAKYINQMKEIFDQYPHVYVPQVYDYQKDILIMSHEKGDYYNDFLYKQRKNPKIAIKSAAILLGTLSKMILEYNFIHADMHQANMLFRMKDNEPELVLLDLAYITKINNMSLLMQVRNTYSECSFLPNPHNFVKMIKAAVETEDNLDSFLEELTEKSAGYIKFYDNLIKGEANIDDLNFYLKRYAQGLDFGFYNIFNLLGKHKIKLPLDILIIFVNYHNVFTTITGQMKNRTDNLINIYLEGINLGFFEYTNITREVEKLVFADKLKPKSLYKSVLTKDAQYNLITNWLVFKINNLMNINKLNTNITNLLSLTQIFLKKSFDSIGQITKIIIPFKFLKNDFNQLEVDISKNIMPLNMSN